MRGLVSRLIRGIARFLCRLSGLLTCLPNQSPVGASKQRDVYGSLLLMSDFRAWVS